MMMPLPDAPYVAVLRYSSNGEREEKMFFFEKKNQKTFAPLRAAVGPAKPLFTKTE
jgi:hypothetical protein